MRIATDYNDYVRPPVLPDIITMNHAHDTHYTDHPDPAIKYVLRGWGTSRSEPATRLTSGDVRVRNVPTNIRNWNGGTERNGNSIFIFEIANMCIAHLGHLHHTLTQQQLNEIGRIDVVMAPVDGDYTLDLDGMIEVLHCAQGAADHPDAFFRLLTLNRFLDRAHSNGRSRRIPSVVVSKTTLPASRRCWCCRDFEFRGVGSASGSLHRATAHLPGCETMLSAEQNDLITRTGPGTAAGALMRRYWQPAALVDELPATGRSSRCGSWARTSSSSRTTRAATG